MNVINEYLKFVSKKIEIVQENIKKEDIDEIFSEDLMEIQVYLQCLVRLCKHKDYLENSYNGIIVNSFYMILEKLSKEELKMLYGFENLGITYQEFLDKVKNKDFTDLEIKVLFKDLVK
ncbi:MAG: hypothetical protein MR601_07145 [Erysipelotrichaceae bacterium]|nr:hypothetical protein [Erysipelotrichaceae bacterium]